MCCCCNISLLKWTIYIACILVLGIGSVLIWVGFLVQASEFVQVIEFSYAGFIVIACGGVLIFIAFIGLLGAWKQRKLFLMLFIVFNIIIGVLLITFGGILIYIRNLSNQYLKDEQACSEKFPKADILASEASKYFCTLYCPCSLDTDNLPENSGIDKENFYRGSADSFLECNPCEAIQTYEETVQDELLTWLRTTFNMTEANATNCGLTSLEFETTLIEKQYRNYIPLITWIENRFQCSSLCKKFDLLMFSSVTQKLPDVACYDQLNEWVQSNFRNYGIISIILGSYQLLLLLFAATLCCCPKKNPLEPFTEPTAEKAVDKLNDTKLDNVFPNYKKSAFA